MKLVAFAIAIVAMSFALAGLVRPEALARTVRYAFTPSGLYVVAVVRLAIGLIFFLAAPGSRAPRALRVVGIMICVVSVALAFFTAEYGDVLREWWAIHGAGFVPWGSGFAFFLGVFVAYATAPRRR